MPEGVEKTFDKCVDSTKGNMTEACLEYQQENSRWMAI